MNHKLKEDLYDLYYDNQKTSVIEILNLLKSSNALYDKSHYDEAYNYFYTDKEKTKDLSDIIHVVQDLIESVR